MGRFLRWFGAALLILTGFVLVTGAYLYFSLPDVRELAKQNPETTSFIEYRRRQAARISYPLTIRHRRVNLEEIPLTLRRTVIVAEDAAFWEHKGVDWHEVRVAIEENWQEGRRLRGASTITQQIAKNLYLTPERSWFRKLKELLITLRLEEHLSKSRILELYLNNIEFGEGIFGIDSAARVYFGKAPDELEVAEMVRLAAVIPKPLELHPLHAGRELQWRSVVILQRLNQYRWITPQEYRTARAALAAFFGEGPPASAEKEDRQNDQAGEEER